MNNLPENYKHLLYLLSNSLFKTQLSDFHFANILPEAAKQTIFPLIYTALYGECDLSAYTTQYYSAISHNVKVIEEHKTLHKLLCENNIPYVFLKGCASARYYPEPLLRTMGDVDLLVNEKDIEKTVCLLDDNDYRTTDDFNGIHIEFKSKNNLTIELHRQINGIPNGKVGQKVSSLFSNIFEKAVLVNDEYLCPSDFHHGLILLLHTASHLTNEGIGLRHLCDWAVFISKFSNEEFLRLFEKPLKEIGLWEFAVILSATSVKYLNCPKKSCINHCDNNIIDGVIEDIFSGGNFGKKDYSRYQQIKYISNRDKKTVNSSHPIAQVLKNISSKAQSEIEFVKKCPFLLPLGCVIILFKYFCLVATKKRKLDNKKVLFDAKKRKNLYDCFNLFETS